jgi:hypothetical protein
MTPRLLLLALAAAATTAAAAVGAPAASAETPRRELLANATTGFGVTEQNFEVGTCSPETELELAQALDLCTYGAIDGDTEDDQTTPAYEQADGHPEYGIVTFRVNSETSERNTELTEPQHYPIGQVKNVRIDLPAGLSVNPQAVPQCPVATFEAGGCEQAVAKSRIGSVEVKFVNGELESTGHATLPIFNLVPRPGLPLEAGFGFPSTGLSFIEGGISWHAEPGLAAGVASGDFHPYFELHNLPQTFALLSVRQSFDGNAIGSGFLRLPSACGPTQAHVSLESYGYGTETGEDSELPPGTVSETSEAFTRLPGEVQGCSGTPFAPEVSVFPSTKGSDQVDGAIVEVSMPQNRTAAELGDSDLKAATIELPTGLSLNPSAAADLSGCSEEEAGFEGTEHRRTAIEQVQCPASSKLGTVALEVPTLPAGALVGGVYLGTPTPAQLASHEYTIYVTAENVSRYGVAVRLRGTIRTNSQGRLETVFDENPQLPFTSLELAFNGGPFAPLANPVNCGSAATTADLLPFSRDNVFTAPPSSFVVEGCPAAQFSAPELTASAAASPATAGATSTFAFTVARPEGQRYIQQLSASLPLGVSARLGSATPCAEAQANAGTCSQASLIGAAHLTAGSGTPYPFTGNVYLTEKYDGAPYGLSIVVPTAAGPFDFGNAVTRAKLEINPLTARVTVAVVSTTVQGQTSSGLPTAVGGIPLRIRELSVTVNRPGFMLNPTNCSTQQLTTQLVSTAPESPATLAAPFAVRFCAALAFTPSLSASTSSATSRAAGAGLKIKISQPPGQANIASVTTTLPQQLPSRSSTLVGACPRATFAANPLLCPAVSRVGSATAVTPTLPHKLTGPVYIVAHSGAFPDLEAVLSRGAVRLILDGHTAIKHGITTATFAKEPDVPLSSFTLTLPRGPHSLLSANGSLCAKPLRLPTRIVGQNGKVIKHTTAIKVTGCVRVTTQHVGSKRATITVTTPAPGRVRFSGRYIRPLSARVGSSRHRRLHLRLTAAAALRLKALRAEHRALKVRVRVRFRGHGHSAHTSTTLVTLMFH